MTVRTLKQLVPAMLLYYFCRLAFAPLPVACAEETIVWQVGQFDRSSNEFRSEAINYADPAQDLVYRVGQDQARSWYRFQPGPANGLAGARQHPFTILFSLPGEPIGVYHLRIDILYETPRLSHLRVELNGRAGVFYFHPRLDYGAGDWEGTFVPQTSVDSKIIDLPAVWFHKGENTLVLTALDEPAEPENSLGSIALGHTGLVYDALSLANEPNGLYSAKNVDAFLLPTIFYRDSKKGLNNVLDLFLRFAVMPHYGEVILRANGATRRVSFSSLNAFGEEHLQLELPEWSGTVQGELEVTQDGKPWTFPINLKSAKKWTLFIVPLEHLDIGFTDYPEKVAELHSQSIDGVLDIFHSNPDFRWTLDGFWVARSYIAGRSAEKKEEFLKRVREGRIVIPPQYANQHTGTASLEGLIRSLYDSHEFAKQNQLSLGAAHISDVPSYSWSYASVLANAGIKYFAAASNNWRAPVLLQGRWNEKSPFYWEGPDGGRVLMWYSRAYLQLATLFGTPPRLAAVRDSLPVFLQAYASEHYKANAAIIYGSQLENTALAKEQAELASQWKKQYAWPRLAYSTFQEALAKIAEESGPDLPVYRGDFGPYWEDGFTSDAAFTAVHRQNQQRILSAEKLATIPSVLNPDLRPDKAILDEAWTNSLLFDEHTWTFVGATTQPDAEQTRRQLDLKRSRATEARREIGESLHRSWAQFESFLGPKDASIAVFNSLSWKRSGLVNFDLPDGFSVFDSVTGLEVPVETLQIGRGTSLPGFGRGYRRVRFLATEVPAMGYKLFPLRLSSAAKSDQPVSGETFENNYYRITIDPPSGALRSIWDKDLKRELVDTQSPYRFGAFLYVTGADDMPNNSLYRYGIAYQPPKLQVHPAEKGHLVEARKTGYGTTIDLESSATNTPLIRLEITLPDASKGIEFNYSLQKNEVLTKEAAYVAFPFAGTPAQLAYETQNGWVDPARDELAGGSREWYAVNHWAAVREADWSAAVLPLDAPLVNFGDIVRGIWPEDFKPRSATIFSWLMSNYWGTNFSPSQGGDFTFRYKLVSATALDAPTLTRVGWESLTPLEADAVAAAFVPGALPSDAASLLDSSNPDVAVVTWKRAEDGDGTILRLEEIAGRAETTQLQSRFFRVREAWRCSALEERQASLHPIEGKLSVSLRPFEVLTVRILTDRIPPANSATASSAEGKGE